MFSERLVNEGLVATVTPHPEGHHIYDRIFADVLSGFGIYGCDFEVEMVPPSSLHFDPGTIGILPLGYDFCLAEDFLFP